MKLFIFSIGHIYKQINEKKLSHLTYHIEVYDITNCILTSIDPTTSTLYDNRHTAPIQYFKKNFYCHVASTHLPFSFKDLHARFYWAITIRVMRWLQLVSSVYGHHNRLLTPSLPKSNYSKDDELQGACLSPPAHNQHQLQTVAMWVMTVQ